MLNRPFTETGMEISLILLPIIMGGSALYRAYKTGAFHMSKETWIPKLMDVLNATMGAFMGVFLGHGILVVWEYKTRPELYAMQSAPWYTSILVYGALTIVVTVICLVAKAVLKYYLKKSRGKDN